MTTPMYWQGLSSSVNPDNWFLVAQLLLDYESDCPQCTESILSAIIMNFGVHIPHILIYFPVNKPEWLHDIVCTCMQIQLYGSACCVNFDNSGLLHI